jgi:effector-binding domain-containing protein
VRLSGRRRHVHHRRLRQARPGVSPHARLLRRNGLLRPARVDPASGYRFYQAVQLARLNRIIALKNLGSTLDQVHAMLDEHVSSCAGCLRLRQAELQSAIAADTSRLAQVEARLRIIELEGAMPVDDIQIKRIPAVRVAELTATAARLEPASINPVIQPLYRELGERLGQAGLTPAGPATSYYEDVPDGDGVIVHAALPVNADPGSAHGFEITDLPEITQAATIMHRGPMDNVMATIQTLARWIDENGYRSSGHVRELTLECPDDPDKWVTELQEPITPA